MKEYYQNLLIIQYRNKEKARKTVGTVVDEIIADNILITIEDAFDIETAEGVQLDILGKYIGVDRWDIRVGYFDKLFAFNDYSETYWAFDEGYTTYDTFTTDEGYFLSWKDSNVYKEKLSDEQYRLVLKFYIKKNNIHESIKNINDALYELVGDKIKCYDGLNMSILYLYDRNFEEEVGILFYKKAFFKPAGVRIATLVRDNHYFMMGGYEDIDWDTYAPDMRGFATYDDYLTKDAAIGII